VYEVSFDKNGILTSLFVPVAEILPLSPSIAISSHDHNAELLITRSKDNKLSSFSSGVDYQEALSDIFSELNNTNPQSPKSSDLLVHKYTPEQLAVIEYVVDKFYESDSILVTTPVEALQISRLLKEGGINFKNYYNPNSIDPSDDTYVNSLTSKEQSHLYLATIQDIDNRDNDGGQAERIVNEQSFDKNVNKLEIYDELMQIATDTTNSRIIELVTLDVSNPIQVASVLDKKDYSGISAGDIKHKLNGVWVRGIYGYIKQGKNIKNQSFYGNTYGGTIGVDGNITDDTLVGISYTRMYADFKYKIGIGNKVNTVSNIMSIYGITKLRDNLLLQGLFSAGKITAKQKSNRLIDIGTYKTAFGNLEIDTYSAETILNYKIAHSLYYVMPSIGFRYNKNYDNGYNEYGTGVHNLKVASKIYNSCALLLGIKMRRSYNISDNIILTPGIHGQIDRYVYTKASNDNVHKQWVDSISTNKTTTSINTHKIGYNLGSTISLGYNNTEILMTYNAHLRGKYRSHQGSFRFKYLF